VLNGLGIDRANTETHVAAVSTVKGSGSITGMRVPVSFRRNAE